MPIPIACPTCTARLTLPDTLPPGIKSLKCPKCKSAISLDDVAKLRPAPPKAEPPKAPPPRPVSAAKPAASAPKPPADAGALPDVDDVGFLDDDAPVATPSPPKAQAAPKASFEPGGLPDVEDVGFLDDDAVTEQAKPTLAPKNQPVPDDLPDVGFLDDDAAPKSAKQPPAPPKPTNKLAVNVDPGFLEEKVTAKPAARKASPPPPKTNLSLEEVGFAGDKPASPAKREPASPVDAAFPNLSLDDEGELLDEAKSPSALDAADAGIQVEVIEPGEDLDEDLEVLEDEIPEVEPAEADEVELAETIEVVDDVDQLEIVDDLPAAPASIKKRLLDYDKLIIKPRTGYLLTLGYDILHPTNRKRLGTVLEETDTGNRVTGLLVGKSLSTSTVVVREGGRRLCTIRRPPFMFKARVEIYDRRKEMLGYFDNKLFSLLGGFWVYDWKDREVAEVKGQWGWRPRYEFLNHKGKKLGVFMYESAATGKITFTFSSGTSWYIEFSKSLKDPEQRLLLMASAIAFDMVRVSSGRR